MTDGLRSVLTREKPLLLRLLRARLGGAVDPEDVWQELWLKLERVPPGPIADPVAFLCRIAMNQAADFQRGESRRRAREGDWAGLQDDGADSIAPERVLAGREELGRIEAAIRAMPERTREAFRLFRLDGLSQREIAAELGISVSGVEKLLRRAYDLLAAAREE